MAITWIASYPKAGSTWARMFISALLSGEVDINSPKGVQQDDLSSYLWQVVSPKPLPELTQTEAFACRSAVLSHMIVASLGSLYCKTHSAVGEAAGFPLIPEALTDKAVFIVRDPRDVAVSYAHHTQQSLDLIVDSMCDNHCLVKAPGRYNALGPWSQHAMSWDQTEKFPVHTVRYEDMLAKPKETFSGLAGFLNLKGDINKAIELTQFDNLKAQEEENGFVEASEAGVSFFRKGQSGAWKTELHEKHVKRLEKEHGTVMQHFGYEMSEERDDDRGRDGKHGVVRSSQGRDAVLQD